MFIPSAECSQDQRAAGVAPLPPTEQAPPARRVPTAARRRYTFALPPCEVSVRVARNEVSKILCGWGAGDRSEIVDSVRLIVSELVTNAVRYAGQVTAFISVTMLLDSQGGLRLGVRDGSREHPHTGPVPSDATSGRGIPIIQVLLGDSGGHCHTESHHDGGKTVWITLPRLVR
ncbi:ATP-binding protein [Kitasatospora sp. NPDC085879]|uniref:ATP-binding protein n=1 Tax=Kitasatospora sp. NPDC085879 TaxID=3154769 RepID=UPI00343CE3E3